MFIARAVAYSVIRHNIISVILHLGRMIWPEGFGAFLYCQRVVSGASLQMILCFGKIVILKLVILKLVMLSV